MIGELAVYPAGVLAAAVGEQRRKDRWFPAIADMIEICDAHMERLRRELRTIGRMRAEHRRRWREAKRDRRQQAADRRWREDLQARFAVAGDALSLGGDRGRHSPAEGVAPS